MPKKNRFVEIDETNDILIKGWLAQTMLLLMREARALFGSREGLLFILFSGPVLAVLIYIVALISDYTASPTIKNSAFVYIILSCSAFCLGIYNSILTMCKDNRILFTELMIGLKTCSYTLSRILLLIIVGLVQTTMIFSFFAILNVLQGRGIIFEFYHELFTTTLLTIFAASCLCSFIFILFNSIGRVFAISLGSVIMIFQLLLTSAAFHPKCQFLKPVSYATVTRCSIEAYGASADFLSLAKQEAYKIGQKKAEELAKNTVEQASGLFGGSSGFLGRQLSLFGGKAAELIVNTEIADNLIKEKVDVEFKKAIVKYGINFRRTPENMLGIWALMSGFVLCFSLSGNLVLRIKSRRGPNEL